MQFALMEATLIVATIAQRFRVLPLETGTPARDAGLTLKVRGGLPSRVEIRDAAHG